MIWDFRFPYSSKQIQNLKNQLSLSLLQSHSFFVDLLIQLIIIMSIAFSISYHNDDHSSLVGDVDGVYKSGGSSSSNFEKMGPRKNINVYNIMRLILFMLHKIRIVNMLKVIFIIYSNGLRLMNGQCISS